MPRPSPLRNAQVNSVPACGKILQKGQSITVLETAIGPREKRAAARGKLSIRKSNRPGYRQIVCTLKD
jgi:hypothetical protein